MSEQVGSKAILKNLQRELPQLAETLPAMPRRVNETLSEITRTRELIGQQQAELRLLREEMKRNSRRNLATGVGSTLVVSAFLISALDGRSPVMLGEAPLVSWVVGGVGVAIWLVAWPRR